MNEDLTALQAEIERRKAEAAAIPEIHFPVREEAPPSVPAMDRAGELVEEAFGQAVAAQVTNNAEVQRDLLDNAERVIKGKVGAIKSRVEQEDKEAHFNNKKNACECFGYNEATTEKWAVDLMNLWHNIMTAVWICIGFVTFAPITFTAKKITVIFKKSWVAILLSIVIYAAAVGLPILLGLLNK